MLFKIQLETDTRDPWWEKYDKPIEDPRGWAKETIECFNSTLRPSEEPRELLDVQIIDAQSNKDHTWVKQNIMTIMRGSSSYDKVKCQVCGITGKRFGLSPSVRIDSKFMAKVYQRCDTAKVHLDKKATKDT